MKLAQLVKAMPLDQRPRIAILTGSAKTKERRAVYASLADGSTGIVVGTHALITDALEFKKLGLAVIDEQHRFVFLLTSLGPDRFVSPPYNLNPVCVHYSQIWVPTGCYFLLITLGANRLVLPRQSGCHALTRSYALYISKRDLDDQYRFPLSPQMLWGSTSLVWLLLMSIAALHSLLALIRLTRRLARLYLL